ncbi:unnamed protein product [Hyaloperonospora brassicae]|uniref:RxLR effector candidate protein n=1 Tax=Hyaloperonospora brassicae TaxID=162125 RepID=A0AAV0T8E8_HYABA|nr:unnamed protein product [Hyaloperonospora brassicae]
MAFFPAVSLFVITPLTLPSLVLVMSLTGIFVELNTVVSDDKGKHRHVTEEEMKGRTPATMRVIWITTGGLLLGPFMSHCSRKYGGYADV